MTASPRARLEDPAIHVDSEDGHRPARPARAGIKARVLIGIRDVGFHQQVLSFIERDPRVDVVGAVTQPSDLLRRLAQSEPDVTVLCPETGRELAHPATARRARPVLLVAEEMTVPVLREAIESGAYGVFAWPEERFELLEGIVRARAPRADTASARGRVIAVYGARGGAGATFLASHLAAAFADRGERTVLVDLDVDFADLTIALGIPSDSEVRTIADLVDVADELTPDHIEGALYQHSRGFAALLGPPDPARSGSVPPGLYPGCMALLAGSFDVVVAHVPRPMDALTRAALRMADEVLLVVTPDLFAVYAARRAIVGQRLDEPPGRCRVVINRAARSDIGSRDVERILGIRSAASVRFDPAVRRAQDRGRLLPVRAGRVGRDIRALAGLLLASQRQAKGTA